MDKMVEFALGEFAHSAEKAIVARAHRQRAEIRLQGFGIVRFDKTNRKRPAAGQQEDVAVLPKVLKAKCRHGPLPNWFPETFAGAPDRRPQARQNGFSASRTTSLQESPTSCNSR